jgi:hypothetical protein
MEKIITVLAKVDDIYGVYLALKRASFAVRNVGVDEAGTHVYLEEFEEKDPEPLVLEWAGRPAPKITPALIKARRRELEEMSRIDEGMRNRWQPEGVDDTPPADEVTPEKRLSLLARILRRLTG